MSEITKNNNSEVTSLENDSTIESKDEKGKSELRKNPINVAVVRGVSGIVKWFSAYKGMTFWL